MRTAIVVALLFGCSTQAPSFVPRTTHWEAAWYLSASYCGAANDFYACQNAQAYTWCPDGSVGACALPVTDIELLDFCLSTTNPGKIDVRCAALFSTV